MNKIITFHDIASRSRFEETILLLKSMYSIVSIIEIEDFFYNKKNLKNSCLITFDDGDISFYQIAYPVLKKHNIPATIFVSPKICKEGKNFWFQELKGYDHAEMKKIISEFLPMSLDVLKRYPLKAILKCLKIDQIWDIIHIYQSRFNISTKAIQNLNIKQLLEIDSDGLVTIGAHTENHPILSNEEDGKSENEISNSFIGLKEILGHEIKYFAFPNGLPGVDFGQREINILKSNNCKLAFTNNTNNISYQTNPLSINRYGLSLGSKSYIKSKLYLGKYWDISKELITNGEIKKRKEFRKKLSISVVN